MARDIAGPFIPEDVIELAIACPCASSASPAQAAYDDAAAAIADHLDAGRDVAMLCEGDPFFYGSFMYLFTSASPTRLCDHRRARRHLAHRRAAASAARSRPATRC